MLIGFIGKMGSGKTTAADYLVENYRFKKTNFKDALDNELLELYPQVIETITHMPAEVGLAMKPTPDALRELKQKHGTEVRRGQDTDYWVKRWVETYTKTFNENVCVDDVRFINEVDVIKRFGGLVVKIERTDIHDTGSHASETELDGFEPDITITADPGDLMMVHMALDNIVDNDLGREEDSDDSCESHELGEIGTERSG